MNVSDEGKSCSQRQLEKESMDIPTYLAFGAIGWIIVMTLIFNFLAYTINKNVKSWGRR